MAVQIITTTAEKTTATELARRLIEGRLAACVQIDGPIESHYRWQGAVEQATEWRVTIKTSEAATEQVVAAVHRHHPYDEPEILVTPVVGGSPGYLRWLSEEVAGSEGE